MNALCHVAQMDIKWGGTSASVWLGQNEWKCEPVMHTGETLVIFSLTDSDQEANVITEIHGDTDRLLPLPSERGTQRGLSSPIREFTWQSYPRFSQWEKIDLATNRTVPSWIGPRSKKLGPGWTYHSMIHFCLQGGEFIVIVSNGTLVIVQWRRRRCKGGFTVL